jgi:hypothetical protein
MVKGEVTGQPARENKRQEARGYALRGSGATRMVRQEVMLQPARANKRAAGRQV